MDSNLADVYPFTSRYLTINGCRLHYIDEGIGPTLLFIHGTPSWSFDFRNVIKVLREKYRCIALDHIGFGLSDKPEHYDYSTINHSKTLALFIEHMRLQDFTMVVHDFGGPIGFNYAIHNAAKVKSFVVLNSWLWSSEYDADFVKFKGILKSPLLPFLYRYFNFSVRFVLPQSFGDNKLSKETLRCYIKPLSRPAERNGTVGFARSLLNDQLWFENLWLKKSSVESKPVLFIWGMKGKLVTSKYLEKFKNGFSNHSVIKLETCGHFPQEEQSSVVTQAILNFMEKVDVDGDVRSIKNNSTVSINKYPVA